MSDLENQNLDEEEAIVTLELDDGETLDCAVLTIFPVGDNDYIALLPLDGPAAEDGEIYLYRYSETPDGEPELGNIEDDDEYEAVSDAFDELLDSQEYDELVSEDDIED